MNLYRQLGFKVPKQDMRHKSYSELLTPYLLLSLLIYVQDTESIDQLDLKQQQNLLKQYGILTNNQYLISSENTILQKISRYLLSQVKMFTVNNIVKMISNIIIDNTFIASNIVSLKTLQLSAYSLSKDQLIEMLHTYQTIAIELNGSQFDFSSLQIPLSKIYITLVNLIKEWNANPALTKYEKIIIATKCFLFGYFLTMAKNTKAVGMNDKIPIPNINPLDLLHHETMYNELLSKFLSDIDATLEQKIAVLTDTLLSLGSYTKPIIWNITNEHSLQYIPFFINTDSTYNDTSTQILLKTTITLLFLQREI